MRGDCFLLQLTSSSEPEPVANGPSSASSSDWAELAHDEIDQLNEPLSRSAGRRQADQHVAALRRAYDEAVTSCRRLETAHAELQAEVAEHAARETDLRRALAERLEELDVVHRQVRALQADLVLKDSYVLELRERMIEADQERASLRSDLESAKSLQTALAETARQVEAELATVKARAGYQLLVRAETKLAAIPGAVLAAEALARVLAG